MKNMVLTEPMISESELVSRLKQGDEKAFELLYHQYKRQIAPNLLRLLKSTAVAEDLLHDLFLKIWENRADLDQEKSLRAYLFRIAHNMVIDFFRKAARNKTYEQHLAVNANLTYSHIEEMLDDHQKREFLDRALETLSPQSRLVFKLCKLEGKSYHEISELLQISPNTVSNHLMKATRHLKLYLSNSAHLPYLITLILISPFCI
uniref:RNA polymerase sigma factor n=1 Tax=Pedobacter schmidteae TaxID=2201271 RepID=UPI001D016695|nr:RNA polymerase sigma-70 factor [Pedobacter schmidteae]